MHVDGQYYTFYNSLTFRNRSLLHNIYGKTSIKNYKFSKRKLLTAID